MALLEESERAAVIEQLAKARVGFGLIEGVPSVRRRSPTCGDEFTVQLVVMDDAITELHWEGHGCVVSTAAAGALASLALGLSPSAFTALAGRYLESVQEGGVPDESFGDAEVFAGIGRYPLRAGCATLAWRAALETLNAPA
jgi:nitrogen fixation NifU-like protein